MQNKAVENIESGASRLARGDRHPFWLRLGALYSQRTGTCPPKQQYGGAGWTPLDAAQRQHLIKVGSRNSEFAEDPLVAAESGHASDQSAFCKSPHQCGTHFAPCNAGEHCAFVPILSRPQPIAIGATTGIDS